MGKYALILLLIAIGCGGGTGEDGFRELDETELLIWDLTVECFIDSGIEPYASMGYNEPVIKIVKFACGKTNFAGCSRLKKNGVEITEEFYFNDDNPTPLNSQLLVHEYKHLIQFQGTGDADGNHNGFWYVNGSPCPDHFLNNSEDLILNMIDGVLE